MDTSNENQGQELSTVANAQSTGSNNMESQIEKALLSLAKGDTMLVSARGVKGDKVELTFAEHIDNPTRKGTSNPLVGLLNKSDKRFTSNKPRQAWITGTKSDISEILGLDVSKLTEGSILFIGKVNPTLNGERLKIRIVETVKADEYQAANIETRAKRAGENGPFILHKGMYIFSNPYVVTGDVEHVWLEPDSREEQGGIMATASEPVLQSVIDTAQDNVAV